MSEELRLARLRIEELSRALEFYADPVTYEDTALGQAILGGIEVGPFEIVRCRMAPAAILSDRGQRARQVLKSSTYEELFD